MSDEAALTGMIAALARGLVDNPDQVEVTEGTGGRDGRVISLSVADEDLGQVIGRGGRVARALRTILRAAATARGERVTLEILD